MYDIYNWLYDNYAVPRLTPMDEGHQTAITEFAARLDMSRKNRRHLLDLMENTRLDCGTEAFTRGVRFGLDLAVPRALQLDGDGLLQFLPKLDEPVS